MDWLKRLRAWINQPPPERTTETYLDLAAPAGTCQHRAVTGDPAWLVEVTCDLQEDHALPHHDPRLGSWR